MAGHGVARGNLTEDRRLLNTAVSGAGAPAVEPAARPAPGGVPPEESRPRREEHGRGAGPAADLWPGLAAAMRDKFPAVYPFLSNPSMVEGRLEVETLTLWVKDDFTKNMVGAPAVLAELGRLASAQAGCPVRCTLKVGKAPAPKAGAVRTDPGGESPEHDNLDDLLAFGRQFDNIVTDE